MSTIKELKGYIKNIPLLGQIVLKAYNVYSSIKPGSQYWRYVHKSNRINVHIKKIHILIFDKGYSLTIRSDSSIFITLINGLKFWLDSGGGVHTYTQQQFVAIELLKLDSYSWFL